MLCTKVSAFDLNILTHPWNIHIFLLNQHSIFSSKKLETHIRNNQKSISILEYNNNVSMIIVENLLFPFDLAGYLCASIKCLLGVYVKSLQNWWITLCCQGDTLYLTNGLFCLNLSFTRGLYHAMIVIRNGYQNHENIEFFVIKNFFRMPSFLWLKARCFMVVFFMLSADPIIKRRERYKNQTPPHLCGGTHEMNCQWILELIQCKSMALGTGLLEMAHKLFLRFFFE